MRDLRSDLEALRDELCDNAPPESCCDEAWIRARVQVVDSIDVLLAAHPTGPDTPDQETGGGK